MFLQYNSQMRKARILLIFGIWIAILPYLGFPYSWKNIIFSLTGLALAYFAYLSYREAKKLEVGKKTFENFSENHYEA